MPSYKQLEVKTNPTSSLCGIRVRHHSMELRTWRHINKRILKKKTHTIKHEKYQNKYRLVLFVVSEWKPCLFALHKSSYLLDSEHQKQAWSLWAISSRRYHRSTSRFFGTTWFIRFFYVGKLSSQTMHFTKTKVNLLQAYLNLPDIS